MGQFGPALQIPRTLTRFVIGSGGGGRAARLQRARAPASCPDYNTAGRSGAGAARSQAPRPIQHDVPTSAQNVYGTLRDKRSSGARFHADLRRRVHAFRFRILHERECPIHFSEFPVPPAVPQRFCNHRETRVLFRFGAIIFFSRLHGRLSGCAPCASQRAGASHCSGSAHVNFGGGRVLTATPTPSPSPPQVGLARLAL
jgi:hypothetical protein